MEAVITVSVIVPVYKVEKYLRKCLDSLVRQTLAGTEIIVVNDASPDGSDIIMEEYREKYPKLVKCIYLKKNLHQGGARNEGVRMARGEYLMFVDSDDYVDVTICEKLYHRAVETGSDVVCCEHYMIGKRTNEIDLCPNQGMGEMTAEKRRMFWSASPVEKIIRKNLWIDNNLAFPEHMKYEDLAVIPLIWLYAGRVEKVAEPLYYYIRHDDSTTMGENSGEHYDIFQAALILCRELKKRAPEIVSRDELGLWFLRGFLMSVKQAVLLERVPDKERLLAMRDMVAAQYADWEQNPYLYNRFEPMEIEAARQLAACPERFFAMFGEDGFSLENDHYYEYYGRNREKLEQLLFWCVDRGLKTGVWGAGKKGKDFLYICDPQHKLIDYVLDKNENNWGKVLETGHTVTGLTRCCEDIDIILVMNQVYFGGIRREVKKRRKDIAVFNLDVYLLGDFSPEEFLE